MANVVGSGIARTLVDSDGDALDDGNGKLNVNAYLSATPTIDIGDVSLKSGDGTPITDTVSGRLDVTLDSTATGHLSEIEGAVETIEGTVIGSEMQVDVVAALPAGSNAIGKLAANSGVDIGDVDVTSIAAGTNIIGKVSHDITGGADGLKVVSSAGTDVVLGGDVDCKKIDIQSQTDNTGLIAVGFTGVDATEATGTGVILYAGDTYSLEITNLNLIYIDSTVSGEGVRYTYFT